MQEIWVVEYSPIQKATHIERLEAVIDLNLRNLSNGEFPGYVPVYTTSTRKQAEIVAKIFYEVIMRVEERAQEQF